MINALKNNIGKLLNENCSIIKKIRWYEKIEIPKNNKYLTRPIVNILSSTSFSISSLEDIEYKNVGFKKVMIKRTEVLRPRVFLKMSVIKPKKKAYINKLITVVSSFIFKIKKQMIIGEK